MQKCEICNQESEMKTDNHEYCSIHYVEKEEKECLYWDLVAIMNHTQIGKSKEVSQKIKELILKKHPDLLNRYKEKN